MGRYREYAYIAKFGTLYKIGYSHAPLERVRSLKPPIPSTLEYLILLETTQGLHLERQLLIMFQMSLYRGEWFCLTDVDIQELLNIKAQGSFRTIRTQDFKPSRIYSIRMIQGFPQALRKTTVQSKRRDPTPPDA